MYSSMTKADWFNPGDLISTVSQSVLILYNPFDGNQPGVDFTKLFLTKLKILKCNLKAYF